MTTGKKPAHEAGKQLHNPKSTPAQKKVAGSDLAQTKKGGDKKK